MGIYSSNRTWMSDDPSACSGNIFDCLIDSEKTNMDIFEAVIDHDFMEAYTEAGVVYMTEEEEEKKGEEKKTGIFAKLKKLIHNIIDAISRFFSKFKKKVQEIVDKDQKLYKKYDDAIKKNGVGKTLHAKYDLKSLTDVDMREWFDGTCYDDVVKAIRQCAQMCQISKDESGGKVAITGDFQELLDKINKELDDSENNFNEIFKEYDNETELKVDQNFINLISNNLKIGETKATKTLSDGYNKAKAALVDLDKTVTKKQKAESKSNTEELEVLTTVSKGVHDTFKPLERMFNMESNQIVKLYKTFRSLYTQLGELCTNNQSSKNTEKEKGTPVAVAAAAMLSDMYVDEAFAFC